MFDEHLLSILLELDNLVALSNLPHLLSLRLLRQLHRHPDCLFLRTHFPTGLLTKHLIFIHELFESLLDDLYLVVSLLGLSLLAEFRIGLVGDTLLRGEQVGAQLLQLFVFLAGQLHELTTLLLLFLQTLAHVQKVAH